MNKSRRAFQAALILGWIVLGVAGWTYARMRTIPGTAAWPVIASILIVYPFYLVAAFPTLREHLAGPFRFSSCALALSVMPYLFCCCGAIPFAWTSLARVVAVGLALGFWFVLLPEHPVVDLGFLALVAFILLGKFYEPVFPALGREKLIIIGHISLYVTAILALMLERRVPETGFGFVPSFHEWRVGALHYLYFLIAGFPLAFVLRATHLVPPRPAWSIAATFLAWLWFGALTEEFFFRGVLQAWFEQWTRNRTAGLCVAAAVFGLIHYWFRGWRWVPLVTLLGLLCGRARNLTGNIRAGVVTHTLVVATWRAFFA